MEHKDKFDRAYARKALILFSAFIITVMYIDTMLVPSLPSIAAQFKINAAQVSLVLSMYLVSGVALNPVVGKLGDIYGKKRVLKYILPVYAVSVGFTGFSPNFTILIISRIIQGIGLTAFPLSISLVREEFPRELIPRAQGLLSAMFGVGAAIGLPLGAFISNTYGWQTTYHTALPFVALLVALILVLIKESAFTRPDVRIDYLGAATLSMALAALIFALSEGYVFGFTSAPILGLLLASIILFVILVFIERPAEEPILDLKLMRRRNVLSSYVIVLIVGFGFFLAYQTYAYEFESAPPLGHGYTIFQTGLALLPFAIMSIAVAPLVARLISRYGTRPFLFLGAVISAIGFLISAVSSNVTQLILAAAVVGAGTSALNVSLINVLILSVDRREMGLAASTNTVFRLLGSSLGAPVAGLLITALPLRLSFVYSFYVAIASFIAVLLVSWYVKEVLGPHADHHQEVL